MQTLLVLSYCILDCTRKLKFFFESLNRNLAASLFLFLLFLLKNPLPLKIAFLVIIIFFQIWVLVSYYLFGRPFVILASDSDDLTNESFLALNFNCFVDNFGQLSFLLLVHIHNDQLISFEIVRSHFIDTLNDLFFYWESFVRFLVLKVNKRRSDPE